MAKQVKMEDVDWISNLPDSILAHILSFLSIQEAVETSFLSTRWRYLFTLLSNLDFDDLVLCTDEEDEPPTLKSFTCLVDRVMLFHNTSIQKFRLKSEKSFDCCSVYDWIRAAVWRKVQDIDLIIPHTKTKTLPADLFSCRTLVTLKLHIQDFVLDVPERVHLPNLKTLHLISIEFSNHDSVHNLFSGCATLEDMVLRSCHIKTITNFNISHPLLKRLTLSSHHGYHSKSLVTIDTPNLSYLNYQGCDVVKFSSENLQSLVEADIGIFNVNNFKAEATTAFFRGISNVRSLILSSSSLELLLTCEPYPVFAAMVKLKIGRLSWSSSKDQDWEKELETLLSNSPELEQLDFPEPIFCFLPERVPPCLLFKLKTIEISNFRYNGDCIGKARYILKNGGALENLYLRTGYLSDENKSKISEVLLASPRESKQCCISII